MKYKLLKEFPWYNIWYIFESWTFPQFDVFNIKAYPDFFEEVKEPKTIYDLEIWDEYWDSYKWLRIFWWNWFPNANFCCFLTEREAKRNKLLRELATRTSKYLPKKWEMYMSLYWNTKEWIGSISNNFEYHCWVIFKDSEERLKYIWAEENNLLLHL